MGETMRLGRTGLVVNRTAFGALPMQRVSFDEAGALLNRALDEGINFIDTARGYSDSEQKIGEKIGHRRSEYTLATKTPSKTAEGLMKDLDTSLDKLKTDCIDVYQFHNPSFVPRPGGQDGLYDAMLKAREMGKIRYIGITNHSMAIAKEAVESGLYDTLQYPFSCVSSDWEIELVKLCAAGQDVGFIAMKALAGGLITHAPSAFAWLRQFENVLPIWGVQRMSELEEFIALMGDPPELTAEFLRNIEQTREELSGEFCRGCGYCLPCPAGIPMNMAVRMSFLLKRSPIVPYMNERWLKEMEKINDCTRCGACEKKCPYGLKAYEILPSQLEFFKDLYAKEVGRY